MRRYGAACLMRTSDAALRIKSEESVCCFEVALNCRVDFARTLILIKADNDDDNQAAVIDAPFETALSAVPRSCKDYLPEVPSFQRCPVFRGAQFSEVPSFQRCPM